MPVVLRASAVDPATWTAGQTVQPARTSASAGTPNASSDSQTSKKAREVAQQFEAVYLRQMIDASLPKDSDSLFGEGTSGTMWRSMFADTLATTLSETGTVGIANMIFKPKTDPVEGK